MEVLINLGLYTPPNPRLVFGSVMERPLLPNLPSAAPPDRLGILLSKDFYPNIGPGKYPYEERTSFIHVLGERTHSKRGVMFGATTEPRPPKTYTERFPSPTRYQPDMYLPQGCVCTQRRVDSEPAPFGQKADRFYNPTVGKGGASDTPGPGNYRPEKRRLCRELKRSHTFGGKTTVLPPVKVKCVVDNEDICNVCYQKPCGDYWENKREQLCRECYQQLLHKATQYSSYSRSYMQTFEKVRDCSDIHKHDGTSAALKLKTEAEIRDLQHKEAYMNLYF